MRTPEEYLAEVTAVLEQDASTATSRRTRAEQLWASACDLADKGRWLARAKADGTDNAYTYADGYVMAKCCLERIQKVRSELSVRPYYRGEEHDYMTLAPAYAKLLAICDQHGITLDPVAQPEDDDHQLQAYDLIEVQ